MVWGALYEMSDQNQVDLDRFEPNYQRTELEVHSERAGYVRAISYVRPALTIGQPSPEYVAAIMKGAKDLALPAEYVRAVKALASSART